MYEYVFLSEMVNRGSAQLFWQLWEVDNLSHEDEDGKEKEEVAMTIGRRARG